MKTVKIPECMNPFEVIVNNQRYRYPGGTEQEVPDEVAEVIAVHMKNHADMTAPPYVPSAGGGYSTCKVHVTFFPAGEPNHRVVYSTMDGNGNPAIEVLSYQGEFDEYLGEYVAPSENEYDIEVLCGSHITISDHNINGVTVETDFPQTGIASGKCLFVPIGATSASISIS